LGNEITRKYRFLLGYQVWVPLLLVEDVLESSERADSKTSLTNRSEAVDAEKLVIAFYFGPRNPPKWTPRLRQRKNGNFDPRKPICEVILMSFDTSTARIGWVLAPKLSFN
jgi:hypothetical protein